MDHPVALSNDELDAALRTLPAWSRDGESIVRHVKASTFSEAMAWVVEIADLAEAQQHHPDIDIRWRTITLRLTTHEIGAITSRDVHLAEQIDALLA